MQKKRRSCPAFPKRINDSALNLAQNLVECEAKQRFHRLLVGAKYKADRRGSLNGVEEVARALRISAKTCHGGCFLVHFGPRGDMH